MRLLTLVRAVGGRPAASRRKSYFGIVPQGHLTAPFGLGLFSQATLFWDAPLIETQEQIRIKSFPGSSTFLAELLMTMCKTEFRCFRAWNYRVVTNRTSRTERGIGIK